MTTIKVPMSAAMQRMTLTVKVTGVRRCRLRLAIASLILRAAASAAGCRIEVDLADRGGADRR